jgi:hypothetical protein
VRYENYRLKQELEMRNRVIQTLCYWYKIRNHEDSGWERAATVAEQLITQGRKDTLNTFDVPPAQRLLLALEKAYYELPGRISMANMHNKPLPQRVVTDATKVAQIVGEQRCRERET